MAGLDLIVLAACKDIEATLRGVFQQPERIGVRPFTFAFRQLPGHDPAVFRKPPELLRHYLKNAAHALVVFDFEGCGRELRSTPEQVEKEVVDLLRSNGWENRCGAVAIDPELETWLHICVGVGEAERIIGWPVEGQPLRQFLVSKRYLVAGERRLSKPKESLLAALRHAGVPRSSSLYEQLAAAAPLRQCVDPAFARLRDALRHWFPPQR